MVSKEVAKKSQDEAKKKNDEAKAKQDKQISSSKQGKFDNRGYDYKSTDSSGYSVGADKGREFVEDPRGNRAYVDQQNQQAQQAQQAQQTQQIKKESSNLSQTNQQANIKFLEANARAGDQKSIDELRKQGREIYTIKQGPYERTYIDGVPEDVVKQVNEGYKDEKGNYRNEYYVKDNFTEMISPQSESVQPNPLDEAKSVTSRPYAGFTENVGFSGAGSTAKTFPSVKKTRVEDLSNDELVKQVGVEKANEIIENRNKIIENNNLLIQQENKKNIDTFLSEGKKLGFKQVQVKTKDKTEFVDITKSSEFLKFGEGAEFTFVKTPEMRKQGRDVRLEQKKFIRDSKNIGSKFLIKAKTVNGKTFSEVIPIEQGYKEMIRNPDASFSSVPNVPKGYAVAGPIGSNILVSTEKPQEIKPEYSPDPFSKWVQEMGEYNPYTPDEKIQGPKKPSFLEESEYFKRSLISDYGSIITGGANLLKTGIRKISPNFMTNIGVAYQKENVATDFAFVPFKVGAEMIEESPVNQTNTEIQPLQEEKLTPEQEKIKEKNKEWSTKDYYKNQQQTWESYKGAVILQGSKVINQASKLPHTRLASDIVGFGSTIVSPRTIVKGIPLRYTSTPFITSKGKEIVTRTLSFGYGKGKLLIGQYPQTGKIFIGKQQPQYSGIENMVGTESKSSFDVNEIGAYSKRQIRDIRPNIEYGETIGKFKPNEFQNVINDAETVRQIGINKNIFKNLEKKNVDLKESERDFGNRIKGPETNKLISELQGSKELSAKGGSDIFNQFKTQIQRKIGDWDFDLLKNKEKLYEKIMTSNITKEGYALFQKGSKIVTGEIDKTQPFWNFINVKKLGKNKFIRGDAKQYTKSFIKNPDPTNLPRGEAFYSNAKSIAFRFAKRNAKKNKDIPSMSVADIDMNQILQFKKLSKRTRKRLAYNEDKSPSEWYEFQEKIKQEAIKQGKKGYTKPYLSTNKNASKYEVVVFDKTAFKNVKNLEPTNYGIKEGTKKDFLNILTERDIKNELANKSDKFFGYQSLGGKMKQKIIIAGEKTRILTSKDIVQQLENLQMSNSQMIGVKSLKNYKGDSSKFAPIFKNYDLRMGFPTLGRAEKDIVSKNMFGLRLAVEASWKSGDKPLARLISQTMRNEFAKHKEWGFNWREEFLKLSKDTKFVNDFTKKDSLKDFASKYQNIAGESTYAGTSTFSKPSSESKFSAKSPSVKSTSVFSVKSPSVKSTSVFSVKSPSVKSTSVFSAKSPSVKSTSVFSAKSPSVKSPSIKSPSIKSPSIKSPSIKSPSLGSSSIKSPSLGSPSIKSPSLKFPSYKQPPFILPKLGGNFGPKKNYFDKRKPAITFRWAVNNPIFKKFSIKEGKKGRTIEW